MLHFHRPALLLGLVWITSSLIKADSTSHITYNSTPTTSQSSVHFRITVEERITLLSQNQQWQVNSNGNLLLLTTAHHTKILQHGYGQETHDLSTQGEAWVLASP